MQTWDAGATWMANQGALLRSAPELADAVATSVPGRSVLRDEAGRWVLRRHRHIRMLLLEPRALADAMTPAPSGTHTVVVDGVGCGDLLEAALLRWPDADVHAWERDPDVLRVALEERALSGPLLSGRLRLHAGAGFLDLPSGEGVHRIRHPDLALDLGDDDGPLDARPWVAVVDGGLFVQDLCDILPEHGYRVFRLRVDAGGPPWCLWNLRRLRPAGVFGINHRTGLAELCTEAGVPLVEWEIDPSLEEMKPASGPTDAARLFTWRTRNVPAWRALGFRHVHGMPLASNVKKRHPIADVDRSHYGAPVSFVGNSMAERTPRMRASIQGLLEIWVRQRGAGGRAGEAAARLVQELILRCRRALPDHVAPAVLAAVCPGLEALARDRNIPWQPAMMLGEIAGAYWRMEAVAALAPRGAHVWGDSGWRNVERNGVQYRGFAGHNRDLGSIYSASDINLDIGRIYQPDIVTMRVFDVLACGGFLLAAWSDGLGDLFVLGEEIETWKTIPELVEKVDYYLAHPAARERIAARGRARVLRDHTIRGRIAEMLAHGDLRTASPQRRTEQ